MQCDRFCQPLRHLTPQFHHWLEFPDVSIQQQQQVATRIATDANYDYYQPSVSNFVTIPVITAVNGTDVAGAAAAAVAGVDDGATTCMVVHTAPHHAQRSAFHTRTEET